VATLTTLIDFDSTDGAIPSGGLTADAAGDLFGTTENGGTAGYGTVFEVPNTANGYADTPITLVNFSDGAGGGDPEGGLIADAAGDLFGTTNIRGAYGYGTVYEIAKTATGYASTPTTLASFDQTDGSSRRPGRGRCWRPVRNDVSRRRQQQWHRVRDRQNRGRLRQHADLAD
jgi:uncharacterized repeat protein (TIGR03803 family)